MLRTDFSCYKKLREAAGLSKVEIEVLEEEEESIDAFLHQYIDLELDKAIRAIQKIQESGIRIHIPLIPSQEDFLPSFEDIGLGDLYPLR